MPGTTVVPLLERCVCIGRVSDFSLCVLQGLCVCVFALASGQSAEPAWWQAWSYCTVEAGARAAGSMSCVFVCVLSVCDMMKYASLLGTLHARAGGCCSHTNVTLNSVSRSAGTAQCKQCQWLACAVTCDCCVARVQRITKKYRLSLVHVCVRLAECVYDYGRESASVECFIRSLHSLVPDQSGRHLAVRTSLAQL